MRRPLFFLLCLLAACTTAPLPNEEAPAQGSGRVVLQNPRSARRDKVRHQTTKPAKWFEGQLRQATVEAAKGELRPALERLYKARTLHPDATTLVRIDRTIRELNLLVLKLPTIEGHIAFETDPLTFGDTLRVHVHLRNVSGKTLRIPAQAKNTSASIFVLQIERREYDIRAQVVTDSRRVHHPIGRDLELPPGGRTELVLSIGMMGNDRGLSGFRTYTVRGHLRPVVLDVGGLRRWDLVHFKPATLRSFRANWSQLAHDPVRRIRQSIDKNMPVHLLTSAALVSPDQRQAAVDLLVEEVRGDRGIDWAMFGALQYLCGLELGRDGQAWKSWWPRVRATYFAETRPERAKGEPVFDE